MITTTYQKLEDFRIVAVDFVKKREGKVSLFLIALSQSIELTEKVYKKYSTLKTEQELLHFGVDDKGYLLTDDKGNPKITPAKRKSLNEELQKLADTEITIETYPYSGSDTMPEGVTLMNYSFFAPFVLPIMDAALIKKITKELQKEEA